ncbi:TPA: restriction endonuclease subunit S [Citrobacter freundii]|uniref:restriction endonuclease subunit S n=1 Tax=Citrobacter freundii complex TaxID=1344959 RepID=UPI00069F70D1|nr:MULTISPECIES: restriction endonuclease subunit S [Citrobacter freundii complex]HBR6859932.1 restriction endonuclease subunit S [Klebsiella aerogenes]EJO6494725.1 restriction endonuclease subunit S [Citrobacter freundii]EKT8688984.1 restriction endonuclease subunit S [Citrobacter freundii]EKU7598349.1 restriction endonuclease subunit S [Citrobacter freundii]ELH0173401.1 restriction endonuclease subunit S [Citrobacter freundii]
MMHSHMTTIGDIAQVFDGPHATPKKITSGPYFLSISSLEKGRLDLTKSAFLSEEDFKKWTKRVTPEEGDLLFSYETRLGEAALMPAGVRACLGRRMGLLRFNKDKVIPEYVLYAYLSPAFQQTIKANTLTGATVDRLSISELPDFPIRIPPLEEQETVANLLGSIDKKIDLNNRINAELEAMAKTLYDYWFVQFDFPDTNGNPYKSSGGKMVYNSNLKRDIPDGWMDSELDNLADLYQPKTISEKNMIRDGKYLVYGANGVVGRFDKYNHEKSVVTITCRGNTCGNINITRPYSWITGNAMVVRPKNECINPYYIYNLLLDSGVNKVITGSAQPQITRSNLAPLKIILPNEEIIQKFSLMMGGVFLKKIAILEENEHLAKLRDWLLPMLMNGQVTVR